MSGPTVRVLQSFTGIRPTTNPYIVQLRDALVARDGVEVLTFDWRTALLGRYDVFHVHWPEQLMGGHKWTGRAARRVLTTLFCLRLWLTRTPVVRTWHNLERPTGLSWYDYRLLAVLERLDTLRIRLNPASPMPPGAPHVTILLGDYRSWYDGLPVREAVPGRSCYVGLIRRYKGVEDLLEAFTGIDAAELSLVVAGNPSSAELRQTVEAAVARDPRIEARLEFIDDPEFVGVVTGSELVVLPFRHMHNSSTVLAALSLGRPVLVPDNEVNRLLSDEVGPGWIHRFQGALTSEALFSAQQAAGRAPSAPPDLTLRTWADAGSRHEQAFRLALEEQPGLVRRTRASRRGPARPASVELPLQG